MPRFFKENFREAPFLEGNDAHHAAKSLRVRVGEELIVCDTKGNDYRCTVSSVDAERVELEILDFSKNATEPTVYVTVFQCLTKGDKMDLIVRQAVECGASRVVPVISENCVSRPDEKSLSKKVERWQRIAFEAAGQSGRGILPEVLPAVTLKQVTEVVKNFDKVFFFYEAGGELLEAQQNLKTAAIIIGPEGGFSPDEAKLLAENGAVTTTLGPRILRAETAPVAALTALMLQTGNM